MLLDADHIHSFIFKTTLTITFFEVFFFFLREEYIKFIHCKNNVGECGLHLSQGRWIAITEPQNWTDISPSSAA